MDREAYERWLAQAKHTLASAERDAEEGDHDWASFKAPQAGEYALKGLLRGLGQAHSLKRLLSALEGVGVAVPPGLVEAAQELDIHYVPARYPEGSPFEFYNAKRAREALEAARRIPAWVEETWQAP